MRRSSSESSESNLFTSLTSLRNLLDTTEKFPEVPGFVKESCETTGVTSFVMDSEVVAYNSETDKLVPFQVLSTRKREMGENEEASVKVIVQAFDLMFLNGESLLNKTLSERRDLLRKHFKPVTNKFRFAVSLDHTENGDTDMIEEVRERNARASEARRREVTPQPSPQPSPRP